MKGKRRTLRKRLHSVWKNFPTALNSSILQGNWRFSSGDYKEAQKNFEKLLETPHPKGWTLFAAKDEAALSSVINDDPEFRNVLHRDLADVPPLDYMRFEQRLAQEFGTQEIVAAWNDVIASFGNS